MIRSMTAFARVQHQGEWGSAVCELRAVNHRYLDLSLRLPEQLSACETALREKIQQVLHRGKVECTFRYQLHRRLVWRCRSINLAMALHQAIGEIEQLFSRSRLCPLLISCVGLGCWKS